jgi:hypothetical protein
MTVAEYLAACDKLSVPNYALYDLTWDSDPSRRLIELYDYFRAASRLVVPDCAAA